MERWEYQGLNGMIVTENGDFIRYYDVLEVFQEYKDALLTLMEHEDGWEDYYDKLKSIFNEI